MMCLISVLSMFYMHYWKFGVELGISKCSHWMRALMRLSYMVGMLAAEGCWTDTSDLGFSTNIKSWELLFPPAPPYSSSLPMVTLWWQELTNKPSTSETEKTLSCHIIGRSHCIVLFFAYCCFRQRERGGRKDHSMFVGAEFTSWEKQVVSWTRL